MRRVEVIGYKRANLGKTESKRLRAEGNVPCVLYGGEKQMHFYVPALQFREVLYTAQACFVDLNIEGETFQAIAQDAQFHPVSEMILHVDFLELFKGKYIKMEIPVDLTGTAVGVKGGGSLVLKRPKLGVLALPKNMPETIVVDVSDMNLGDSVKVASLETKDFEILNSPLVTIASVVIPRALKAADSEGLEGEEGEEGEEGAEASAEGEGVEAAAE